MSIRGQQPRHRRQLLVIDKRVEGSNRVRSTSDKRRSMGSLRLFQHLSTHFAARDTLEVSEQWWGKDAGRRQIPIGSGYHGRW
jgi:hypothetical protein